MRFGRIFGASYDYFMYYLEKRQLRARRARLLSGLEGHVLEVGVGTGVNLEHYSEKVQLTGIEPSPYMFYRAEKKRDLLLFPDRVSLHNTGCGYDEMQQLIAPGSLDAVVCTLVLCTIPDPGRALDQFMMWLKPGGRLLILEHVRAQRHLGGKMQDFFNPVWEKVAEGCQLNRPTDALLKEKGFLVKREEYFKMGLPFYEAELHKPVVGTLAHTEHSSID